MKTWRLLSSGFSGPYTNMAIDEAIFIEHCLGNNSPTLRIYGWKPSSISIGYFQSPQEDLDLVKCAQENVAYVRRITGGGIIFHDEELTYSLVCSEHDLKTNRVKESFKILCSFIINVYKELGLNAAFAKDVRLSKEDSRCFSSFCFASNEECDILIKGKKIGGNAQRRRKNIIFQHGSIPLKLDIDKVVSFLKKSPLNIKDKICSLEEVVGRDMEFSELENLLVESFKKIFLVTLEKGNLTTEEESLAQKLEEERYSQSKWNLSRTRNDFYIKKRKDVNIYQKAYMVK